MGFTGGSKSGDEGEIWSSAGPKANTRESPSASYAWWLSLKSVPLQMTLPGASRNVGEESKQGLAPLPEKLYMMARNVMPYRLGVCRLSMARLREKLSYVKAQPWVGGTPGRLMGNDWNKYLSIAPDPPELQLIAEGPPGTCVQAGDISVWLTNTMGILVTVGWSHTRRLIPEVV